MRRVRRVGRGGWVVQVMCRGRVESRVGGVVLGVAVLCPWGGVPGRLASVWQTLIGRRLVPGRLQWRLPVVRVPARQSFRSVVVVRRREVFVQVGVRHTLGSCWGKAAAERGARGVRVGLGQRVVVARAAGARSERLVLEMRG